MGVGVAWSAMAERQRGKREKEFLAKKKDKTRREFQISNLKFHRKSKTKSKAESNAEERSTQRNLRQPPHP
jgi:hypothetical protein